MVAIDMFFYEYVVVDMFFFIYEYMLRWIYNVKTRTVCMKFKYTV